MEIMPSMFVHMHYLCVSTSMSVYSSNGLIEAVGPADSIESRFREAVFDKILDATGMCVLPGKCLL